MLQPDFDPAPTTLRMHQMQIRIEVQVSRVSRACDSGRREDRLYKYASHQSRKESSIAREKIRAEKDPHLNPLPYRERGNRYSIFEPPAVPLVGPAPRSSGWPLDGDVDAFADDTPDDVPDDGSGVIEATPEFAVVVDDADVLDDAVPSRAASGGVSVGPLKFSGAWPCSIAGVTTQSPPSELRHTVLAACVLPAVTRYVPPPISPPRIAYVSLNGM